MKVRLKSKNSVTSFLSLLSLWLIFLGAFFACDLAFANENQYGLAMHGAPKYGPQDTHVEYADPNAPKGGSLKTAAIGTFDTINPYAIKGKAALGLNLVYDRLMARVWDEPFTMYPLIAERYDMPEDRSSITFTLNPKARFHDDAPITADDIIFSFETLRDFGRPNMRRVYKLVKSVTKQEDGSIRFDFGDGYDRETALIIAMMPVLSKASWQGQDFDSTTLDKKNLNGPYRIKNIDAGRSITYQRIPDYWAKDLLPNKGHYNFDEITYDYYRDDNVAFEAFAAGDLTLRREGDSAKWDTIYDFPAVQSGETVKTAFDHGRPQPARGFIFNTRRPPFDDINVRHALSLVLDRNAINALLYNGEKRLIKSYFPNSPFSSMHPDDNQDLGDQQTDPDFRQDAREQMRHAATLLKQSGWAIENGQQTKNDKTLSFELLLQTPEDEKLALHYAQSLKRLGIDLRIRVTDSADFLRRLNAYDFDMVLHDWQSSLSPGTEQLLYWGCAAATQPGRFNYAGICDPDIDAAATSVADTKTRVELVETMRKLDAKLLAGYYMVPLFYNAQDYIAYDRHIHAPQTTPLYGPVLETWWMERN